MSDISTLIYKYLATNFAKQDWSLGSVIRELLAQPMVKLAEEATTAVNASYNQLDIAALLANPEQYPNEIDQLFNTLQLETPQPTVSRGSVQILTSSGDDFVIPANTSFSYNDTTLVTEQTYTATSTPTASSDLILKQIGINAYAVVVPVASLTNGVNIAAEAQLNWSQLGTDVYEVKVYSAITGGVGAYTATEKINLIQQQLFPSDISSAASILKTINNAIPDSAVDCTFATNNKDYCGIYVKPAAMPEHWTVNGVSTSVATNTCSVSIDGTGIHKVVTVNGAMLGSTVVTRVGRNLTITYAGTPGAVVIDVFGFRSVIDMQQALDNYTANTGVIMNLLTPNPVELSVYIPISGSTLLSSTLNDIVASVNNSQLNSTSIGDATIRKLIEKQDTNLTGAGLYTLRDMVTGKTVSSTATAAVSPFIDNGVPAAVYTATNLISTTNG